MNVNDVQSPCLKEAIARGFCYQSANLGQLDKIMLQKSINFYLGFDATANSLHIGNLTLIMFARLLQNYGHTPIILIGDGTTLIGDPSGKNKMRQMLSKSQIDDNVSRIKSVFNKYLHFDSKKNNNAKIVCNSQWLHSLNYLDFLQKYGKHFSINRMLTFDSVKSRIDNNQSLSFLEFNYMILQAYDFLNLYNQQDCILQIGGSDQWGNIVNGVELIKRINSSEVSALTTHLITTADGKKMGKSVNGAIWLNSDMLQTFDFWQYWRNVQDTDVEKFLRLYTNLSLEKIAALEQLTGKKINQAKKVLADEVTTLCRGEKSLETVHNLAQAFFNEQNSDQNSEQESWEKLPTFLLNKNDLISGILVIDLLNKLTICKSKGEAKRLINGKGVKINDIIVDNIDIVVNMDSLINKQYLKLSSGKKKHFIVKISEL